MLLDHVSVSISFWSRAATLSLKVWLLATLRLCCQAAISCYLSTGKKAYNFSDAGAGSPECGFVFASDNHCWLLCCSCQHQPHLKGWQGWGSHPKSLWGQCCCACCSSDHCSACHQAQGNPAAVTIRCLSAAQCLPQYVCGTCMVLQHVTGLSIPMSGALQPIIGHTLRVQTGVIFVSGFEN